MTFKELKVGARFIIVRENDTSLTYSKINDKSHYNTMFRTRRISIAALTQVKEII